MASKRPTDWRRLVDWHSPHTGLLIQLTDIYFSGHTEFQPIDIVNTPELGKCLVIDGAIQSSTFDEHIYHECLVHPALMTCPEPKRVLVIGGGEGGTLREILRYPSVEKAVMIDIDRELIELCKKHLPEMHQGSFDDSRVELIFQDGRKYVEEIETGFDAIILDLTDPTESGVGTYLYTREFYRAIQEKLSPQGVLVTQATSPFFSPDCFTIIHHTLEQVFDQVRAYNAPVRTYGGLWGWAMASQGRDPLEIPDDELARRIEALDGDLQFYHPPIHRSIFTLSRSLERAIQDETRVSSDDSQVFMPI